MTARSYDQDGILRTVVGIAFGGLCMFPACDRAGWCTRPSPVVSVTAVPVEQPRPQPPPCIHEKCEERPAWLTCVEPDVSASGIVMCKKFKIDYEHHCSCDTWGPAQEQR